MVEFSSDAKYIESYEVRKMIYSIEENILSERLEDLCIGSDESWGIYGTGKGAELIYSILCSLKLNHVIKAFIDRDECVCSGKEFFEKPVKRFSEIIDQLDGIIIAAMDNHLIIEKRIYNILTEVQKKKIRVINIFTYNTVKDRLEYLDYLENRRLNMQEDFVAFDENGYSRKENDTKIIAWYLPQFHQMEINNRFHGQGFTEWTNTSKSVPLYVGHYQPHIPYDVGYYDLLNPDTFKRQIYLARHYGIYGFCFHYYWFSGKRLMEKPIEYFLKHKELDMPFCLDWATENWTALWDGGNQEIMLEQNLKDEDDQKFMEDILPFFCDSRYIKIDGKPVLVIYRINMFEKERAKKLLNNFRKIARDNGFPDLYIMLTNAFSFHDDVTEWGADALVEYPPHVIWDGELDDYEVSGYLNPHFNGRILDASSFIKNRAYLRKPKSINYYRSALVSWDNTARKTSLNGVIIHGLNPGTFKVWLKDIIAESKQIHSKANDIVFINSWNEWAEGSHLEPDLRYGYAYLQAVKEVFRVETVGEKIYSYLSSI